MSGINSWVAQEDLELGSLGLVDDGDGPIPVQVLSRHDVDSFDVIDLDKVDMRVVPMADLRPVSFGPFVVSEDDGQGGETLTYFRRAEAAYAYSKTVDGHSVVEGLIGDGPLTAEWDVFAI